MDVSKLTINNQIVRNVTGRRAGNAIKNKFAMQRIAAKIVIPQPPKSQAISPLQTRIEEIISYLCSK